MSQLTPQASALLAQIHRDVVVWLPRLTENGALDLLRLRLARSRHEPRGYKLWLTTRGVQQALSLVAGWGQ